LFVNSFFVTDNCRILQEKIKDHESDLHYLRSELEKQRTLKVQYLTELEKHKAANEIQKEQHQINLASLEQELRSSQEAETNANVKNLELQSQLEQLAVAYEGMREDTVTATKMLLHAQRLIKQPPLPLNVSSYLPNSFQNNISSLSEPTPNPSFTRTPIPAPISSIPRSPPRQRFTIPVFCRRNVADLPNIFDVLNNEGKNSDPNLLFHIEKYEKASYAKDKLGVVLTLCANNKVDNTDKELLVNLREKKGFANVIMVALYRHTNDFAIDPAGKEKGCIYLTHFRGKIQLDFPANKSSICNFFEIVKLAFA